LTEQDLETIYGRFDEFYEILYGAGAGYREAGKEIIAFRVVAIDELNKPRLRKYPIEKNRAEAALKTERKAYFEEARDFIQTKMYDYGRLAPGSEISGPAIVETPITSVVINQKYRANLDEYYNLLLFTA